MDRLMYALFNLIPQVRYVAVFRLGQLSLCQRSDPSLASAPESDRYEELVVNPTVLTLTQKRGDIDCDGLATLWFGTATPSSSSRPSKVAKYRWRSSRMLTRSVMLRRSCNALIDKFRLMVHTVVA